MKFWFYLIPLILIPSLSFGTEYLKLGDIAFGEGHYRKARDAYRQAVIGDPKSVPARMALGHALFALGDYKYAFIELRKGLELHGAPQQIHPNLIEYYPYPDDFFRRLKKLTKIAYANPLDIPIQFVYGYVCFYSGHKRRARRVFQRMSRLPHLSSQDKRWVNFYLNLLAEEQLLAKQSLFVEGVYALKEARYFQAYKSFLRVNRYNPSLGIPPLLLAHSFFALGYYSLAFRYVEKGIFFRPHNKILNSRWGQYYKNKGEWLRFLIALEGHVNVHPQDLKAKQVLVFMYFCFKKYGPAEMLARKLASQQVKSTTIEVLLPLISRHIAEKTLAKKSKSLPKKLAIRKSAKKLVPKKPAKKLTPRDAYFQKLRQLGKSYFQKREYNSALVAFNSLLPRDKKAYYELGYVYFAKELFIRAGDMVREGLRRNGGQEIPHIIDYFKTTDEFFRKKRKLEKTIQANKSEGLPKLFLALAEYRLGKFKRAKTILTDLVKLPFGPTKAAYLLLKLTDDRLQMNRKIEEDEVKKKINIIKKLTAKPVPKKVDPSVKWLGYSVEVGGQSCPVYSNGREKFFFYKGTKHVFLGFAKIEGKKHPSYLQKGQRIVDYQGKPYLLFGKNTLRPLPGSPPTKSKVSALQKGPSKKGAPVKIAKKTKIIKLDGLTRPAKASFKITPSKPLWTRSN